jgi:nucleotide-binding universal stress UspA family protein
MKILLCSDGTPASDNAAQLCRALISQCEATITLLGIAEQPVDEQPLRSALEKTAASLRMGKAAVEIAVCAGDPILQILQATTSDTYDLVIIGTRGRGPSDFYLRSARTYEVIKAIEPPVLVAIGDCEEVKRILVCTGGKHYIDSAVNLTADVAICAGASVTLLHVMAEPPAMYADLVALEEDVNRLIESGSELGLNLLAEKDTLEKRGVRTEIQIRHGIVIDQIFKQVREGNHDLIVTGSSQAHGFRYYIMGDLTREILNRANIPVLVARASVLAPVKNLWNSVQAIFGAGHK